jgi:hypothetical protein
MPIIGAKGSPSSGGFGQFAQASGPANYIEDVFQTWLYTGNGSTQTITNGIDLAGKGGLVWLKDRSNSGDPKNHYLYDTVRGTSVSLSSNLTNGNISTSGIQLTAFNNNGFNLGSSSNINQNTFNYASWTFREQPKFFDVVTYTGNNTSGRTVAHNLGSVPGCIIVKQLNGANPWFVYHRSLGASKHLRLNTTNAELTTDNPWNNTSPTSTVFTLGDGSAVNGGGNTYVAYLFAHDAGGFGLSGTDNVISCGSYTGNGSSTGPTVTLGYEPQWILVKSATLAGENWYLSETIT